MLARMLDHRPLDVLGHGVGECGSSRARRNPMVALAERTALPLGAWWHTPSRPPPRPQLITSIYVALAVIMFAKLWEAAAELNLGAKQ